jgi:hypothetical protein
MDVSDWVSLPGGGTPAVVWRGIRPAGDIVVKLLHRSTDCVDGHDLGTFISKPAQIAKIKAEAPLLGQHYVDVLNVWSERTWGAYAMPFIDGRPLPDRLVDMSNIHDFRSRLRAVLRALTEDGYATASVVSRKPHLDAAHFKRIDRRLRILNKQLGSLVESDHFVVNGTACVAPRLLIEKLRTDAGRMRTLAVPRLYFPAHGDLNIGNVLTFDMGHEGGSENFVLIDPRGQLGPWDPVYDLAKVTFSLTAYSVALASGFELQRLRNRAEFIVTLRDERAALFQRAASDALEVIEGLPFMAEFERHDPHWRHRLRFVHAVHHVAEAACRLSDRKWRGDDAALAPRTLALGFYLLGSALLNEMVEDGSVEASRDFCG